MDSAVSSV
ncbi:hypothetical protein LINPERPRIM_LOCUS39712 [Linum perenne]